MSAAPSGLYVHVPFCVRKCPYCDFASVALAEGGTRRYVDAVLREAELRAHELAGPLGTLYLGGGTPTALPADDLARLVASLLERYPFVPDAEATVEANPGTLDERMVSALLAAGANRLSVGVQSFDDRLLRVLGRIHDGAEAVAACELARRFPRWSLDLIHAIPGQTEDDLLADVRQALALGARHVSSYSLTYEEGTPLTRARDEGRVTPASEDEELRLYTVVEWALGAGGVERYEVSNYARPGEESRHNLNYWRGGRYVGLGAAAHSFVRRERCWNVADPAEYVARVGEGDLPAAGSEALGPRELFLERLMLGLRMCEGLAEDEIRALAAGAGEERFARRLEAEVARGNLARADGRVHIAAGSFALADRIIRDLA